MSKPRWHRRVERARMVRFDPDSPRETWPEWAGTWAEAFAFHGLPTPAQYAANRDPTVFLGPTRGYQATHGRPVFVLLDADGQPVNVITAAEYEATGWEVESGD